MRHGFTTIEMVAVLFLTGLLAGMTALSLASPRQAAELGEVADHLTYCDSLLRDAARRDHRIGRIHFDSAAGVVSDASVSPPRILYRLTNNWSIDRLISSGADPASDAMTVPISAAGLSPSYGIRLSRGSSSRWLVVSGMTGQVRECKNEQEATNKVTAVGDDAR